MLPRPARRGCDTGARGADRDHRQALATRGVDGDRRMLTAFTSRGPRMFARPTHNSRPGRVLVIADIPRTERAVDVAVEAASWPGASVVLVIRPSLWFECAIAWHSLAGVGANTSVDEFLFDELLALLRQFPAELPIELGISRVPAPADDGLWKATRAIGSSGWPVRAEP